MTKAEDYRKVVVAYRNGTPIRLEEIARVVDDVENNKVASLFNNERAIVLAIQRQPDANTVAVVDQVRRQVAGIQGAGSGGDPDGGSERPLGIDSRLRVRRSGDVDHRDHAGRADDLHVPAHGLATLIPALAVPISLAATCG